ncbi:MAG: prohibitin family protein [Saprospiraceae bacterium]
MSFNKKPPTNPIPASFIKYIIFGVLLLFLFIALTNTTFLTLNPGEKGVLFKRFSGGLEKDKIYSQGFHMIAPWNKMYIYDSKLNQAFEKMDVLSKNGLNIVVELSYRYRPIPDKIGHLHNDIGSDYMNRIIKPEIRSATREVIGQYLPEELYSTKRENIQAEIYNKTRTAVSKKNLEIDAVLIRSVQLPDKLKEAIEFKLEEEQQSLQYEFKLVKQRKEAERIIIEATAKAEANRILNASLSDKILRDKGIEATIELAKSENAKVVVVGGSGDGLPLILNN